MRDRPTRADRGARLRRRRSAIGVLLLVAVAAVVSGLVYLAVPRGDEAAQDEARSAASAGTPATPSDPGPAAGSATPGASPQDGADGEPEDDDAAMPGRLPASGTGDTTVLDVPGGDTSRTGRRVRYTVEIEGGLGIPADHYARVVHAVLTDEKGWERVDGVHFVNVGAAERAAGAPVDVRIILGSPSLVDRNCAPLRTGGRLSCHARGKVMLNAERWAHGAETYGGDVARYRVYLVSHEVGHSIGHGHRACPGAGRPAPVMLQQTKFLQGCRAWPWPRPPAGG